MKRTYPVFAVAALLAATGFQTRASMRPVNIEEEETLLQADSAANESLLPQVDSTMFIVRELDQILGSLGPLDFTPVPVDKVLAPWTFSGYHNIKKEHYVFTAQPEFDWLETAFGGDSVPEPEVDLLSVQAMVDAAFEPLPLDDEYDADFLAELELPVRPNNDVSVLKPGMAPKWLRDAMNGYRIQEDFMYRIMTSDPSYIEYAYWDLPVRPSLPDDEISFENYIKKLDLPEVDASKAELMPTDTRRIHWLHTFNSGLQFSQAYVSANWYQGGNNHLSLLMNLGWNVQLNQVYHPNLMFQSNLQYKLGLNSTPDDEMHSYSISEDVLQYNLNAGFKAFKKWFYSFNMLFKTQLLNNYKSNSMTRKASFLSPGDLNLGLGMSYTQKKKDFQMTATISPISYNLRTCIDREIDPVQFHIDPGHRSHSEIGSNGEVNINWNIAWNINYKTRFFVFSDYKYFLSDWENTVSFNINRYLSTQVYVHMRYDTSTATDTKWKHFMLREILSFGLSYTFSTKP